MTRRGAIELGLLRFFIRHEWVQRLLRPLIGRYNPFLRSQRANPYPRYARLRRTHPVYWSPAFRVRVLTRYDDVQQVLKDPSYSVQRFEAAFFRRVDPFGSLTPEAQEAVRRNMLMVDPPDHTRLRNLVNKAFTPRVVEGLRPRIQALADELLDRVAGAGEMELVRDYAHPLPVTVIAEMLGVSVEDRARFKKWSNDLATLVDPAGALDGLDAVTRSFEELMAYFRGVFAERRREPRNDLISALVAAEEQGDVLSETELLSICGLILGAGHETTSNLLGNAVVALLRNPGERKRLQDDPSLIKSAVEEFLRYDSPVQGTDRLATREGEIGGKRIPKGQLVVLLLGAANRDPARFSNPDRLDLGRPDNHHLAFSHGVHFCLGAQLARAEAQIAIATLLRRFPDFEGDSERVVWRSSMTLRGPVALPLSLEP